MSIHEIRPGEKYLVSKTEFKKQLRWLVHNPPEGSVTMTITPSMAEEMLRWNYDEEGNNLNRPKSAATAKKYARQMTEGKWIHTGQPIIFSPKRLIDGQHRLWGCVESGKSFICDVRFGVDEKAFSFVDIGKTRTASDIFAINGIPNAAMMAAAVRWIANYEAGRMTGRAGSSTLTPDELHEIYVANERLQESAHFGYLAHSNRLGNPSLFTALHYLCGRKNRTLAGEFFEKVGSGYGFTSKREPAYLLYRKLVQNLGATEKLMPVVMAAFFVKAWNAERAGATLSAFKFNAGEKFPRIR